MNRKDRRTQQLKIERIWKAYILEEKIFTKWIADADRINEIVGSEKYNKKVARLGEIKKYILVLEQEHQKLNEKGITNRIVSNLVVHENRKA